MKKTPGTTNQSQTQIHYLFMPYGLIVADVIIIMISLLVVVLKVQKVLCAEWGRSFRMSPTVV